MSPGDRRSKQEEEALIQRARAGSAAAFDELAAPHLAPLRRFVYRYVAHPEDAEDITQDTLVTAFARLASFRGSSRFGTWLFSIATRKALDHLRARKRWPVEAQARGEEVALDSPEVMGEIHAAIEGEQARYEYRQHLSYCFSCVARSLPPEQSAALMLREVGGLEARDAAAAMGLSQSTYKHRLSAARAAMADTYEGLCRMVSKQGICYQCKNLRDLYPEERQTDVPESLAAAESSTEDKLRVRLRVLREADLDNQSGVDEVHRVLFRFMTKLWD